MTGVMVRIEWGWEAFVLILPNIGIFSLPATRLVKRGEILAGEERVLLRGGHISLDFCSRYMVWSLLLRALRV
jgi:hypothetical protein